MTNGLNIGVAGCGIGGLAAALFLTRAGHEVSVLEQFDSPAPVGSGLVIQPVGLAVLEKLGLGEDVKRRGHPIYKMYGVEAKTQKDVLNVDYGPINGAVYGLGIHRASLFDILYTAVKQTSVRIKTGHIVTSAHNVRGKAIIKTADAQQFGPFDLVIDASGANSNLTPVKSRALSYGALWGTVDWPAESPLPEYRLSQCYQRARHMLGVLPLGTLPGSQTPKAAIFWSEKAKDLPAWPEADLRQWKNRTTDLWPEFLPFVEQIQIHEQMTPAVYHHGTLWKPYQDQLVFIGDSAHQASPQLGQGANMALLDAQALADSLDGCGDIVTALKSYTRKRRWHVQLYQQFSAVFTPFYQSDSLILPPIRDYIMNPLSRIWPVKPMLTRLVCGTLIKP